MKRVLMLLALFVDVATFADTNVSGNIGANTTWTVAGSPYILTGSVTVGGPAAPTLTIQPGVVVKGNAGTQLLVGWNDRGALVANGTAAAPILFTANGSTTPGFWYGVRLGPVAGAPASSMSYATVEYAGSNGYELGGITILFGSPSLDHVTSRQNQYAGIRIDAPATPSITASTVRDNAGRGIYLNHGGATLTDVALISNSGAAISAPVLSPLSGMTGLSATGNGVNGVEYRGGTISENRTWKTCAIPYVVAGTIYVDSASGPVLTIEQGNTIRFNSGTQIAVNYNNKGGLQANGTAGAPILFTSNGSQTAGYWAGLYFGNVAGGPASSVSWTTIEYGGSTGWQRGGIAVAGLSPLFEQVTLRNNAYAGATLHGGSPTIRNATISGNSGPGIYAFSGTTGLTLSSVAFTNNAGYAATLPVTMSLADASNLTATGNGTGRDAIEFRSGTINANSTWPRSTIPYVVTSTVYVDGASAPILTIAAGNTIRFNSGAQIAVNYNNKGGLQANGTAEAPILFTSNGSQTAGYWAGLYFGNVAGGPPSSVSWATIEYGGSTGWQRGGIAVDGLSPLFEHVTLRNNVYAGATLNGGSPTIRNATISGNSGPGIYAFSGTPGLTLNSVAFTNNAGYAATLPAPMSLADASNLTATGNGAGRDAIEYRGGTINANSTWPRSTIPYVVTSTVYVDGASAPILTIAAGNTVRFNSGAQIAVNYNGRGALQANGTAEAPILFTSNGSQAAGYWLGLFFGNVAGGPPSSVSWATIEYGGSTGYQRGGITVDGLSPVFDHLTIRENVVGGLVAQGTSTPHITNTWFLGNPQGVKQNAPAVVSAELNYWNTAAGPCLPGSCATGQQSASSGVRYEPWLLSAPTTQQYVAQAVVRDRTFSPAIQAYLTVEYSQALPGPNTMTIRDSANGIVRTFSGTNAGEVWDWNGANDFGVMQPDGTYTYEIVSTHPSLPPAAIAKGLAIIDSARTLTLSNPTSSLAFFSPNKDGVQDTTLVAATTNYDNGRWTLDVLNPMDTVILTREGSGTAVSLLWDGEADGKIMQLQGLHTFRITASMGTASVQKTTTTTLDTILPDVSIATPAANAVMSNVYANGSTTVTPTGSVSDVNLLNWIAQAGAGASPTSWAGIGSGTAPVSGGNLGTWNTANNANGIYSLRLVAADRAGNSATATASPVTLGNFKVTQSTYQFNGAAGATQTYTSTIPFSLTETIVVKNLAGTVVRTLVSSPRAAGTFQDAFNGRNDANVLLPDGPYFYVATVTDGLHTMTWDQSNVFRNDYTDYNDSLGVQAYDPFNNVPLRFNYQFFAPARVTIATTTSPGSVIGNCQQPNAVFFCPVIERWEESGVHTFTWSGIDHTGGYRAIRSLGIVSQTDKFPKNAVVLFGTKPTVQNVRVTPPVFGPAVGEQLVEFDLTTYQSQPASISIAFVNLSTFSTLRTVTADGQPPGHRTIAWDGRADNEMLVAPGFYAVRVTATDNLGNVVSSDILTTIKY